MLIVALAYVVKVLKASLSLELAVDPSNMLILK